MSSRIILNETSYFGPGAIQEIVPEVQNRGCKKVMVVTDKDLMKFQVATKVTGLLDAKGIAYEVYDKIKANPTIENVQEGVKACKECGADILVAIGGGSAIDTSKAIAIIMKNPEFADVRSLEGASPTKHKAMPIIAVSTTSGTAPRSRSTMSSRIRRNIGNLFVPTRMIFRSLRSLTPRCALRCRLVSAPRPVWMHWSMPSRAISRRAPGSLRI